MKCIQCGVCNINQTSNSNCSLLWIAVENKHIELTKIILNNPDLNINQLITAGPIKNLPITFHLVKNSYSEVFEALLGHPDLDVNYLNSEGYTVLWLACEEKQYKIVKLLLKHKCIKINTLFYPKKLKTLCTILDYSVYCQNLQLVKLLLVVPSIDVNKRSGNSMRPLLTACVNKH